MSVRKREWVTPKGEKKTAWQVDYRDNQGKRRSKQFSRKKAADDFALTAGHEVRQGIHTADSASVTVAQAADIWIATAEAEERERSTVKQYKELARLHIVPFLGNEKLSRLTAPAIQQYRDDLLKTRSRAMAGKAVRALSSLIGEAMRRGLVAQNAARGVTVVTPKRKKAKVQIPTREELKAIIGTATDDFRPFVVTAIFTGLRSSELRGLRWSDINLKAGTVTVEQRADQWGVIGPPKSDAGYRTVPLAPMAVSELRTWKLRAPKGELGLAFPNSEGGILHHSNLLRRKFWPLLIAAGVCDPVLERGQHKMDGEGKPMFKARYSLHALRHAAASAWIKQRIDLKRLSTWMGHSSIQITLDTYGHLIADEQGDAALVAAAQAALLA